MKCCHPETKYALVNGERISINDYNNGTPFCENGHTLIGVKGEQNTWHFRHKHSNDVSGALSEWHKEWQRHFEKTEVCFEKITGQVKERRADIVEGEYVVEIQHSSISKEEVDQRNKDYELNKKKVLWIIDGTYIPVNGNILTIDNSWKYTSFVDCEYIFINILDNVYKIIPQSIKSLTIHANSINKDDFIDSIKKGNLDKWEVPCQSKLFVKQQGAGNGKTWGIIQMLGREQFKHYRIFIFVTKQHSARVIIKEEFRNQQSSLGFTDISEIEESSKKFLIHYKNSDGKDCSIIIATIDSFMYSVGNKEVKSFDKFQGITQSIVEGHMEVKDKRGTIQYAKMNPKLNAETLYIIDEAQDLKCCYAKAVLEVMKKTNMDVYVVGDKLQSISNELNSFAEFQSSPLAIIEEPVNICRRFIEPDLIDFVNHMVPFKQHDLQEVSPYKIKTEGSRCVFPILSKKRDDNDYIDDTVGRIMFEYNKQVEENGYMPENFLIVVPFVSINPLANILDVAINNYWKNKLTKEYLTLKDEYWKTHNINEYYRYCIFHKSEEGTSINLEESLRSTRIVSIHASKGDGREVVFVIGIDEYALKKYSGIKDSLIYDSLLHVAITRMKKVLYFFYGEDEIGRKIKEWLHKKGEIFDIKNVFIGNSIDVKDILRMKGEELNKLYELEFDENTDSTELIEMGHHNIRYGILIEKCAELLLYEKFDKNQQAVIKMVACKAPVVKCYNWKEYNNRLKWNKDFKDGENICKEVTIPLLYNEDNYKEYYSKIVKVIDNIKHNCKLKLELCPLELIVFYYMKQITQRNYKTPITILELYNIFHVYEKSYQHPLRSHQNCLCKKMFRDNENGNTLTDYLVSHYEQMLKIDSLISKIIKKHPNTSWNNDHSFRYTDEKNSFLIKSTCPFIGYNETEVIILYIKPNLNTLNFNEIKSKSILDTFLIQKQVEIQTNNYKKYNNKKIKIYIVATNLTDPYEIPITSIDPSNIISDAIYEKYSIYNNEFYYFYLQYRKKIDYKTFLNHWETIKRDTKSECPHYISDFITIMKRESKRGKIPNDDLDSIFVSELNDTLRDSINEFLGL